MKLIPLKAKYGLSEDDINALCAALVDGRTLEELYFQFSAKLNVEQLFIVAGVVAQEMYECNLNELCPALVEQRRTLNAERYAQWQLRKDSLRLLSGLRDIQEDLSLLEIELKAQVRV